VLSEISVYTKNQRSKILCYNYCIELKEYPVLKQEKSNEKKHSVRLVHICPRSFFNQRLQGKKPYCGDYNPVA
jgi:hypothetical protein